MEVENINGQPLSVIFNIETLEEEYCWICFDTHSDEHENLVSPCLCRGVNRWVHQDCMRNLMDEQIKSGFAIEASFCPLCSVEYIIVYNEVNFFVRVLNEFDVIVNYVCQFITAGFILCVVYWTAISYGAMTMIQIMGRQKAITLICLNIRYMVVLVLPSLPILLILGKTINWEATLLLLVKKLITWLPPLRMLMPSSLHEPERISTGLVQFRSNLHPVYAISACFFLPTISFVVGNILFFNRSYSSVKKTLLGGLVYICVKKSLGIYQQYYNNIRNRSRRVVDYPHHDN